MESVNRSRLSAKWGVTSFREFVEKQIDDLGCCVQCSADFIGLLMESSDTRAP